MGQGRSGASPVRSSMIMVMNASGSWNSRALVQSRPMEALLDSAIPLVAATRSSVRPRRGRGGSCGPASRTGPAWIGTHTRARSPARLGPGSGRGRRCRAALLSAGRPGRCGGSRSRLPRSVSRWPIERFSQFRRSRNQALELLGGAGVAGGSELVPLEAADLVEGLGGPADHMERVQADDRVGGPFGDDLGDPGRVVRGHELEVRGPGPRVSKNL